MKRLLQVTCAACLLGVTVTAQGAGPALIGPRVADAAPLRPVEQEVTTRKVAFELPAPAPNAPPAPAGPGLEPLPQDGAIIGEAAPLYGRVRYDELDEVHPCAAPIIVLVPDPCARPNPCCAPPMVAVKICVPPNCKPRVKNGKGFFSGRRKIEYIYGDYSIEIKYEKNGWLEVEYHD